MSHSQERMIAHDVDEAAPGSGLAALGGRLDGILDVAAAGFDVSRPAAEIVDRLARELHDLRRETPSDVWRALVPRAQGHRVAGYLMQDPFTQWSFKRPRGYPGDAGLLDIYYQHASAQPIIAAATRLGREIYACTSEVPSAVAGRERRDILAETVDEVASRVERAEVLSIACGHLREAERSKALAEGRLKRWVGLDQDQASVEAVERDYGAMGVSAVNGSVRGILRRSYDLGTFDLVYASGLYDYLPKPVGVRLLQRAVEFLRPGGVFLFANYSDGITSDGYMETFMDWPLILRSADDMRDIVASAVDVSEYEVDVFYGSNRDIVYAKMRKKAA